MPRLDALPPQRKQLVGIVPSLHTVDLLHVLIVEGRGELLAVHDLSEPVVGTAVFAEKKDVLGG